MPSDYYTYLGKIVYNGDVASADDLNTINTAVDAAFEQVETDIAAASGEGGYYSELAELYALKAEKWAENPYQVEVETGQYSALHWSTVSQEYAGYSNNSSVAASGYADDAFSHSQAALSYSNDASGYASDAFDYSAIAASQADAASGHAASALGFSNDASDSAAEAASYAAALTPIASVAALIALDPTVGGIYRTNGFTTPGDGGGATYLIVAGDQTSIKGSHLTIGGNTAILSEDIVNFKMFGAIGDGVTNDRTALLDCLTSGKAIKDMSESTYRYTSGIDATGNDINLETNCTFLGNSAGIKVGGSLVEIGYLSSGPSEGDTIFPVSSTTGLSAGDFIVLHNQDPGSFSDDPTRTYYTDGEHCQIKFIDVLELTVEFPLITSYPALTTSKIFLLDSPDVVIKGGRFISDTTAYALDVFACLNPLIEKSYFYNSGVGSSYALSIDKCYGAKINKIESYKAYDSVTGTSYGVVFSNTSQSTLKDSIVFGGRHAVASGGNAEDGSIPCRRIRVVNCKLYNDNNQVLYCADFHGNTVDSKYIDCEVHGGYGIGGKDNEVIGGKVYEKPNYAKPALMYTELVSGKIRFKNIEYVCHDQCTAVNFLNNSSSSQTAYIKGEYYLEMEDIRITNCNSGKTIVMNAFDNCTSPSNWIINGLTIEGDTSNIVRVISWFGTSGTSVQPNIIKILGINTPDLKGVTAVFEAGITLTCLKEIDSLLKTYHNNTSIRALSTEYTNTVGSPIVVSVHATATGGTTGSFVIDGVAVASSNTAASSGHSASVQGIIIPYGSTYRFNIANATLSNWQEYY